MILVRQEFHQKLSFVLVSFLIILQNQATESISVKGKQQVQIDHTDDITSNNIPEMKVGSNSIEIIRGLSKCKTTACKTEASRLLYYMDHAADYRKNFNGYACGGIKFNEQFVEADPNEVIYKIIEDELNKMHTVKSSSTTQEHLRSFYEDCLNYEKVSYEERMKKGSNFLNSLGLKYLAKTDSFDFTNTITTLVQLDSFPIFDIGLEIDNWNTSHLVLKLTTPNENNFLNLENEKQGICTNLLKSKKYKNLHHRLLYSEYEHCMRNYSDYIKDTDEALLAFQTFGDNHKEAVSWVEEKLIPLMKTAGSKSKDSHKVDYYTVSKLQEEFKLVNWKLLFSSLFKVTISDNDKVQVHHKSLRRIFDKLNRDVELWKLNNALFAHLTRKIHKYFVKPDNSYNDRKKFCLKVFSDLIPDFASNLLMKNVGSELLNAQHTEVARIYESLRNTLLEVVNEVFYDRQVGGSWLDEKSVTAIRKKINSLNYSLPIQRQKINLDLNFNQESKSNNFIANTMALIKRRNSLVYSLYGMDSSSPEVIWLLYSKFSSLHGLYIYEINTLAIPEFILIKHNREFPDAVNLARLGFEIASGFIRAFDRTGIKFDHENKQVDIEFSILTQDSYRIFDNAIESLKIEDGNIELHEGKEKSYSIQGLNEILGSHPFSQLIVNEKGSDIGAAKLAFEALKRYGRKESEVLLWGDFSKEELYFLTLEQEFCTKKTILDFVSNLLRIGSFPPFLRERNIFSNSLDFMSTFSVPVPENKEIIRPFPYFKKYKEDLEPK